MATKDILGSILATNLGLGIRKGCISNQASIIESGRSKRWLWSRRSLKQIKAVEEQKQQQKSQGSSTEVEEEDDDEEEKEGKDNSLLFSSNCFLQFMEE